MKILLTLALISILAVPAFAGLDPDPDMMGLYFDEMGDVVCTQAGTFAHVPVFVLYTRPSVGSVSGFECGITIDGATNTFMSIFAMPAGFSNAGTATNLRVTFDSPIYTSKETVLAELDLYYLEWGTPMALFIGPSDPSSSPIGKPVVMVPDEGFMSVGTSVEPGTPAAMLNSAPTPPAYCNAK